MADSRTSRGGRTPWYVALLLLFAASVATAQSYTVSGTVFSDPTATGVNSGQGYSSAFPSVYVVLTTNGGTYVNAQQILPGGTGSYSFTVASGNYIVALCSSAALASTCVQNTNGTDYPSGYYVTNNNHAARRYVGTYNGSSTGNDFGLSPTTLSGTVYYDANDNGSLDTGEGWYLPNLPTVYVKLLKSDGSYAGFVAPITSGNSGQYTFTGVPFASYKIILATNGNADNTGQGIPSGYVGLQNGSAQTSLSVGPGNYSYAFSYYNSGFGVVNTAALQGYVYVDVNDNSTKDSGEYWSASTPIYVKLLNSNGSYAGTVATITADSNGFYSLPITLGNSYIVALATNGNADNTGLSYPAGYTGTQNSSGSVTHSSTGTWTIPLDYFGMHMAVNIVLTITADNTVKTPGNNIVYTIQYTNPSSSTAAAVNPTIADIVPTDTSYVSASCGTIPTGLTSCTPAIAGSAVTWALAGSLSPGASGTLILTVKVN